MVIFSTPDVQADHPRDSRRSAAVKTRNPRDWKKRLEMKTDFRSVWALRGELESGSPVVRSSSSS